MEHEKLKLTDKIIKLLNGYTAKEYDTMKELADSLGVTIEECSDMLLKAENLAKKKDAELFTAQEWNDMLTQDNEELLKELDEIRKEIFENKELDELDNKRPKVKISYPCRPTLRKNKKHNIAVDPRIFLANDFKVQTFSGEDDDIACRCLNWIIHNIKYVSDGKEYWQFAHETMDRRQGDCEDGAILLANMLLESGIDPRKVRLNAGDVEYQGKTSGHAYVTYYSEEDKDWFILDWCYWPEESKNLAKTWEDAKKYFGVWFSFNKEYIFADKPFEQ